MESDKKTASRSRKAVNKLLIASYSTVISSVSRSVRPSA